MNDDLGLAGNFEGDVLGSLDNDRMRETKLDLKVLAFERCTIANAYQLELLGITFRNALNHIVDERTRKTVEALCFAAIVRTLDDYFITFDLDIHHVVEGTGEFALGAFDRNSLAIDLNFYSGRIVTGILPIRDTVFLPSYQI